MIARPTDRRWRVGVLARGSLLGLGRLRAPAAALWLLAWLSAAMAHSFYSTACCSGRDCSEAPLGSVTWTPEGWRVEAITMPNGISMPEPVVVPFGDPRIKAVPPEAGEDHAQQFHICISSAGYLRCLYAPGPGI